MRRSKRRLSFCIAAAMLISLMTYPSVFGGESQNYRVLLTEDFEGETNKFDSNCTNETLEGQNAGKISKSSSVLDFEDVCEGGVKLSYDVYAKKQDGSNVNGRIIVTPAADGTSDADYEILQVFQRRVRKYDGGDNIYEASANGWLHIEQILNLDDGTVKTSVYSMDRKLLGEGTLDADCDSIGSVTFKSVGTMDFYLDNVKAETCDPTETPEEPPAEDEPTDDPSEPDVYLSEDFEGETNAFSSNCNNVAFEGKEGKVGEVPYNPAGSGQYTSGLEFDDISGGGVKISYDLYLVGGQSHYIKAFPVSGKEYPLLHISGLELALTNGGEPFCTASAKGWVHVEQYMKLDLGTVNTYAYSADGKLLGEGFNNIGYNSITSITFCNWSAGGKMNLYIDNILIENYNAPPELTKASFTKTDYAGNLLSGTDGLTPGISAIAMDFGTKMDSNTLSDIVLQKADGTAVTTTGELNGTVYTLTLGQGLEPKSEYKVIVPSSVASIEGVTLGSKFTYEFATGAGETAIAVTGVTKNGAEVTELSQLASGDTLTISAGCGNLTGNPLPVTCVVTYYSGKSMTGIEVYNLSAPTGFGVLTQDITLPSLSGVDKIKVVALNDLYGMIAYHEPKIIK